MDDLRYPVGKFRPEGPITGEMITGWIDEIAAAPSALRQAVAGLTDAQLDTPYRPGGWTVRQVVHHVADSHLNSYTRFKLALTEEVPTVKPYDEARWAELPDGKAAPVDLSLTLLDAMTERWVMMLRAMAPADFARTLRHPESGVLSLDRMVGLYAWHGRHHVAHVARLREREGWN